MRMFKTHKICCHVSPAATAEVAVTKQKKLHLLAADHHAGRQRCLVAPPPSHAMNLTLHASLSRFVVSLYINLSPPSSHSHRRAHQSTTHRSPTPPSHTDCSIFFFFFEGSELARGFLEVGIDDEGDGDGAAGGVRGGGEPGGGGVARRRRAAAADGDDVDGKRAHHHRRHRLRRAVAGVGHRAAGVGGRPRRHAPLRLRHLLHLHAARRVLPLRRPLDGEAQLHVHGRRACQPWRRQGPALRHHPVRQSLRRRHRLHHRRLHQHAGDQEGRLLPQKGAQERVPQLEQPVHDLVWSRRDRLLADTGLRSDMVALHRRRRHVLHLLHHRPLPWHRADCLQRWVPGQPHRPQRRRRRDLHAEGVAQPPGLRRHRLRLLLLHHPHRDTGHDQGATSVGGEGDEEGDDGERGDDDGILHAVRVHGVRGVRRRGAGQPAHGVRLLRAVLAAGHRQRRHRRPPRRRVPGLLPAALRLRREVGGGDVAGQPLHLPGGEGGALRAQRVPAHLAHGVRLPHHRHLHAAPLLRRRRGAPRRRLLLAAHRLLPHRDVHRAARRAPGQHAVALPQDPQRRLPRRVRLRRGRLHRRRHRRAQGVPPVQRLAACSVHATCVMNVQAAVQHSLPLGPGHCNQKERKKKNYSAFCDIFPFSTLYIIVLFTKS